MLTIRSALTYSGLLLLPLSGCSLLPRDRALPDLTVPHEVSQPATLTLWVRRTDGTKVEQEYRIDAGWWVASPQLLLIPTSKVTP